MLLKKKEEKIKSQKTQAAKCNKSTHGVHYSASILADAVYTMSMVHFLDTCMCPREYDFSSLLKRV